IRLLTFHMSKPSQSTAFNNHRDTLNVQSTQQFRTCLSITQSYTAHPSNHHPLSSFWSLHILCLHCPRLAAIYHYALNTSPINFAFQLQRSSPCREDRWEFPKLSPCTFYSHARGIFSTAA